MTTNHPTNRLTRLAVALTLTTTMAGAIGHGIATAGVGTSPGTRKIAGISTSPGRAVPAGISTSPGRVSPPAGN